MLLQNNHVEQLNLEVEMSLPVSTVSSRTDLGVVDFLDPPDVFVQESATSYLVSVSHLAPQGPDLAQGMIYCQ